MNEAKVEQINNLEQICGEKLIAKICSLKLDGDGVYA